MLYFLPHDATRFHEAVVPALTACLRARSFAPALELVASLVEAAKPFAQPGVEPLLTRLDRLPFDRGLWREVTGEVLLIGAVEWPVIQTPVETWGVLVDAEPLAEVLHGTRDLAFGGRVYRPGAAGWNDRDDVRRLAAWLGVVDVSSWTADRLPGDEADRAEELEFARERWADVRTMYVRAVERDWVMVCERVG